MKECLGTWVAALIVAGIAIYVAAALSGCAAPKKPATQVEITNAKGEKL